MKKSVDIVSSLRHGQLPFGVNPTIHICVGCFNLKYVETSYINSRISINLHFSHPSVDTHWNFVQKVTGIIKHNAPYEGMHLQQCRFPSSKSYFRRNSWPPSSEFLPQRQKTQVVFNKVKSWFPRTEKVKHRDRRKCRAFEKWWVTNPFK